jgi:hypothetical protein
VIQLSILILQLCFLLSFRKEATNSQLSFEQEINSYKANRIIKFKFYDNTISIRITGAPGTSPIVFISLHDDETTAQRVVSTYLKNNDLAFIQIENNKKRLIRFTYLKRSYAFDPNRIFSREGIKKTLKLYGSYSPVVANKVKEFAALILNQLNKAKTIIAVHNNSNGKYSILSYLQGGKLCRNAIKVNKVAKSDPDDFFLTTSLLLFEKLKKKNFNVVLQDNLNVYDDGSLSFYYRHINKRYINMEARKGHFLKQAQMLRALMSIIQ